MISQTTIANVFETARVEEVIGDFVQLKKSGSNYKGLSPFSNERTPSFMVSPVKQIWKDFSSGKGGSVVTFLMEHEKFTYPEAIKYLANKYGIEIEETEQTDEQKEQASERESLYLVNEYAKDYFQRMLTKTDEGKAIGLSYFKERGFTDETIKTFQLGYSPNEWEAFTNEAVKSGYQLEFLEKTGLTIVKEEKKFDRFKGRVMFPIHSMSGRVLGFGGRILDNSNRKAAKYLNSPQSEVYDKSKVLYGIYYAKQSIAKEDNCYLVEGYTDVIQFHQSGIQNVVSSSGTALTPEQIRLINRLTKNITVLFDGDAAGMRASLRGIDLILEQGMNVKVCTFPDGEDPDSFAKNNTEEDLILYLQENAKDFINFKASLLVEDAQNDPVKKAGLIRDMVSSISKIPEPIQREVYIKETSRIMDISEEVLFSSLAQQISKEEKELQKKNKGQSYKQPMAVVKQDEQPRVKIDRQYELERTIISLLLLYGTVEDEFEELYLAEDEEGYPKLEAEVQKAKVFEKIYLDLQEDEIKFTNEDFQSLYTKIISRLNVAGELKIDSFINEIEPHQATQVTSILMDDEQHVLHDWERKEIYVKTKKDNIAQLVSETILSLRQFLVKQQILELMNTLRDKNTQDNSEVLQDTMDYKGLELLLSQKLNRVL